jgi:hypothetical protein
MQKFSKSFGLFDGDSTSSALGQKVPSKEIEGGSGRSGAGPGSGRSGLQGKEGF